MSRSNYFSRASTYKPKKNKTSLLVVLTLIGVLLTICIYLLNNVEDNQQVEIEEHFDGIDSTNLNDDPSISSNTPDLATNKALADATYIIKPATQMNSSSIGIVVNQGPE